MSGARPLFLLWFRVSAIHANHRVVEMNIFSRVTNWIISVETDVVRLICTILPWLVPLVPAWLTYRHAIDQMQYSQNISLIMGIVVEGLGLASLVTSFTFWAHNRKFKDVKAQMPLWVPIATYVVYLVIVLIVNVVLDFEAGVDGTRVLVVALFSLLSLPAGALLSVQTLYNEWNTEHSQSISERRAERSRARGEHPERSEQKGSALPNNPERSEHASKWEEQIQSILERTWQAQGKVPGGAEVVRALNEGHGANLDRAKASGYISTLTKEWMQSKGIERQLSKNGTQ